MSATHPTSLRIPSAAKRRIAAAARRRGMSTQKFILEAALREASAAPDDTKLDRLAKLVEQVREAVEDEIDVRIGDAAWARHLATGSRLHSSVEIKRELGL